MIIKKVFMKCELIILFGLSNVQLVGPQEDWAVS
jgi:hypothetical protein